MIPTTKPRVKEIEKELRLLRSFMIGLAGKDSEGDYRPEFVAKILRTLNSRPEYRFTTPRSFLSELRKR